MMLFKRHALLIVAFLMFSTSAFSDKVDAEKARKVATNWYQHYAPASKQQASITKVKEYKWGDRTSFFICSFDQGGFVIVSANDQVTPILGYGFEHGVPDEITNEAVKGWFDGYARQIDTAFVLNLRSDEESAKWNEILTNKFPKLRSDTVGPLLTTTWDQGCFYNEMCPADPDGTCGHTWVGCTATAMAQIMKYWNYPEGGVGYHSYLPRENQQYGQQSIFFNETDYNWTTMPENLTYQDSSVATLMYHCGVSADMDYSISGSSSHLYQAVQGFKNNFDYSDSLVQIYKSLVSDSIWKQLFKQSINLGRPVLMDGYDAPKTSGHAWVCDGFQNQDYFHMNWGWSGVFNGFFMLDNLNPGGNDFNNLYTAIINLKPNFSNLTSSFYTSETDVPLTIQFIDNSKGNPDIFSWNFGDNTTSTLQNPIHVYADSGSYSVQLIVNKGTNIDTIIKLIIVRKNLFTLTNVSLAPNLGLIKAVDYNVDGYQDIIISGGETQSLYKSNGGSFEEVQFPFTPQKLYPSFIHISDIENNGYPDILLTGQDAWDGTKFLYFLRNDSTILRLDTLTNIPLSTPYPFSFADYDNDGKTDLLLDNQLYRNVGDGRFLKKCIIGDKPDWYSSWQKVVTSSWADYDLDGDLDVALGVKNLKIFRNDGNGIFTDIGVDFFSTEYIQNIVWGDYNNDGLPDILVGSRFTSIIENMGNDNFEQSFPLEVSQEINQAFNYPIWGDVDNDGDLDIITIMKGFKTVGNTLVYLQWTNIHKNNNVVYSPIFSNLLGVSGSINWIDYDHDNKLDLLLSGHFPSDSTGLGNNFASQLYKNRTDSINMAPSVPSGLISLVTDNNAILSWNASTDDHTNSESITYNLRIGTSLTSCDIYSPLSDPITGSLYSNEKGNAGSSSSWNLKNLINGKYYWSVQAIDNSFAGSSFSVIDSFMVAGNNLPPDIENILLKAHLNTPYTFHAVDFVDAYADPEKDSLQAIRIDSLPAYGTLSLNDVPVGINQIISKENISNLSYYTSSFNDDYFYFKAFDGTSFGNNIAKVEINILLFQPILSNLSTEQSSFAFGDYNNDGFLDLASSQNIYKNIDGVFQDIGVILSGTGEISWGDIDGDGDLDLLAGEKIIKNFGNDEFIATQVLAPSLGEETNSLGDIYTNNSLDYFRSGTDINSGVYYSKIYPFLNEGIYDSTIDLLGFRSGYSARGDFDNDGDQDLALCGIYNSNNERKTVIYRNEKGLLVETSIILPGINVGTLDWGDFDRDGDLDLLVCGSQGTTTDVITKVYVNQSGDFTESSNLFPGVFRGFAKWIDVDSDGFLDILLGGFSNYPLRSVKLFKNVDGLSFTEISSGLPDLAYASVSSGDFNNDGAIDIVLSGLTEEGDTITKLYRNCYGVSSSQVNIPPSAPVNLSAVLIADSTINLSWNRATDDTTPEKAITYNLYIGTSPDSTQIMSPMANLSTGYRKIPQRGNVDTDTTWIIKRLSPGTYYWSVQAIDNSFAGGPFAPVDTFTVASIINQEVNLSAGWNIASWNVIPENMNIQEILQPIIDDAKLLKGVDENGNILQQMPWGWVNSIGNMANTEGYQIKITEPCTLSTTGLIVALPMDIPFISGWNLMGWPAQSAEDAQTAFTALINTNHLVKVIDQSGNILQQMPWGWVNNIGSLSPGQGYQVKVSSNCAITINQPVGDNILAPIKMSPTRFMRSQQKGNPYNPMTFALRNNDNLPQNTEIGVYYKDQCFGAAVLTGDYIYITAGMDEPDTEEKEGFGAGEAFHFKYITEGMQEAQELEVAYIEGDKSIQERGTFVGEIKSVLAADELQATASWIGDAHPNPTRDEVFVDLSLAEPSILYLSLMDSHGKIVLEERTEKPEGAQRQRINLSEFSPGVYFLKIQIENESAYQEKVLRIVRM